MSAAFRLHDTGEHPENPERLVAIERRLRMCGALEGRAVLEPPSAGEQDLMLVHDPHYIHFVEQISHAGGGYLDSETYVSPGTWAAATKAAGAAILAVDTVLDSDTQRVFALVRPPGHHAERDRGMGFCIFNNIAIGARHAVERRGLARAAIVDWDVHHGNGTQSIFYDNDQVLYVSVHQWPLYPGTGMRDEVGVGYGQGHTMNVPLPPGTGDDGYLQVFDEIVEPRVADYQPELLLISAGFDAHRDDPLAMMEVTDHGFYEMAGRARRWADTFCGGRLVMLLEGGYNQRALAASVAATLRALDRLPFEKE